MAIKKMNKALRALDNMSQTIIDLSYKTKVNLVTGNIESAESNFLKDILVLKDAIERDFVNMRSNLSTKVESNDLYSIIS